MRIYIKALAFASEKHAFQRRKGCDEIPYINHCIKVSNLISEIGKIDTTEVLIAALLHDTIEDTNTTVDELSDLFGKEVSNLVLELTDDQRLHVSERKFLQVENAHKLTYGARLIKISDKASNVYDLIRCPLKWTIERKQDYVNWATVVVEKIRGTNKNLENYFDEVIAEAKIALKMK